jgi:hypothetical protein
MILSSARAPTPLPKAAGQPHRSLLALPFDPLLAVVVAVAAISLVAIAERPTASIPGSPMISTRQLTYFLVGGLVALLWRIDDLEAQGDQGPLLRPR